VHGSRHAPAARPSSNTYCAHSQSIGSDKAASARHSPCKRHAAGAHIKMTSPPHGGWARWPCLKRMAAAAPGTWNVHLICAHLRSAPAPTRPCAHAPGRLPPWATRGTGPAGTPPAQPAREGVGGSGARGGKGDRPGRHPPSSACARVRGARVPDAGCLTEPSPLPLLPLASMGGAAHRLCQSFLTPPSQLDPRHPAAQAGRPPHQHKWCASPPAQSSQPFTADPLSPCIAGRQAGPPTFSLVTYSAATSLLFSAITCCMAGGGRPDSALHPAANA